MKKLWLKLKLCLQENISAEQDRLIAWLPFFFAIGIALYFSLPFEPNIWVPLTIFELWLLLFYLLRFHNMQLIFIAGLFILGGFLNIQAHTLHHARHIENLTAPTPTYLRGKISDISFSEKGKMRLLLQNVADFDKPLKGNFRLTVMPRPKNIAIGQCIETVATIFPREPLPVLNGYRLDRKLFYENLSAIGYTNSETFVIDCPENNNPTTFRHILNNHRQQLMNYIKTVLPPAESSVAGALLLGEKSGINRQIAENYRNSGLAHFLSVSGLHLGAIAGLIFFVTRFLLALFPWIALHADIKKLSAVVAIIFSAGYLLISGMAVPAQRAFIMTAVVLTGVIFNRQALSMRMVSFAAFMVLLLSPQALISVSFQMSFAAVYALIAFYESNRRRQYHPNRSIIQTIFAYLAGILICDFVASLATAPFSLYHFQRLALYTSLGNLLAGPLIGLYLLPLMLICLITLPLHLAFYPLHALGLGINILNTITRTVADLPYSVWQTDALPFWGLSLTVIGGFWLCIWQRPWRKLGLLPIIIGLLPLFFPPSPPDMIFSPQAQSIAIRNDSGDMVLATSKNDSWLKQIWQENLGLNPSFSKNSITKLNCTDSLCTYTPNIAYDTNGSIYIQKRKIDTTAGGYIYLTPHIRWQPMWNNRQCRAWDNCQKNNTNTNAKNP